MAIGANTSSAYGAASCAMIAFILLVFATGSGWMVWGLVNNTNTSGNGNNGMQASIGMGPFVAGISALTFTSSSSNVIINAGVVLWTDLNTGNACDKTTDIYVHWSQPNGLCSSGQFKTPSHEIAIEAMMVLACLFSGFSCCAGFTITSSGNRGGCFAAITSLLAMICCIAAFSLYTTWPIVATLLGSKGGYVPVWVTQSTSSSSSVVGISPLVTMTYGTSFIITVASFLCLLCSTVVFLLMADKMNDFERGDVGAYGSSLAI